MPALRLTDLELEAILTAARPLQVHDRDAFLKTVASELAALPAIGPGAVHRVAAEVQRRMFFPPLAVD